jgi:hypothetical protein
MIMRINCQYCSAPNFLNDAQLQTAVTEASAANSAQHVIKCHKCRKVLKVSVQQLKRHLPKGDGASSAPPTP